MSKNIFSALAENSDSEKEEKSKQVVKPTKKESRAEDKVKREVYGDTVVKDPHQTEVKKDGPKNKGDYASGEKRPFERHSGTGRQAFGNSFKKGGYGKSNVGKPEDDPIKPEATNEKEAEEQKTPEQPKQEPREEIITLEEYAQKNSSSFGFLKPAEEKPAKPLEIKDKTVKMVEPRQKEEVTYNKKGKAKDTHAQNPKKLVVTEPVPAHESKRKVSKKNTKTEFNDANFPALS